MGGDREGNGCKKDCEAVKLSILAGSLNKAGFNLVFASLPKGKTILNSYNFLIFNTSFKQKPIFGLWLTIFKGNYCIFAD